MLILQSTGRFGGVEYRIFIISARFVVQLIEDVRLIISLVLN